MNVTAKTQIHFKLLLTFFLIFFTLFVVVISTKHVEATMNTSQTSTSNPKQHQKQQQQQQHQEQQHYHQQHQEQQQQQQHFQDTYCYHTIKVVDKVTGRGVPMVNLTMVNLMTYYTDSNGVVAFNEPGIVRNEPQLVWFTIVANGYKYYKKDFYGFDNGVAVNVSCNGKSVIEIDRINVAERIYRITGYGIYRDSALVNEAVPGISSELVKSKFLFNGKLMGQDTVMTAIYKGRLYWFWGDTNRINYPLGNFFVTGATSLLPGTAGYLDIDHGIDLDYFMKEDGTFVKPLAQIPPLSLPVWVHCVASVKFNNDTEKMFATFVKPNHDLSTNQTGILQWNDQSQEFELVEKIDPNVHYSYFLSGHVNREGDYLYMSSPFPEVRVPYTQYANLSAYESFSPLLPGTKIKDIDNIPWDRNSNGTLRYGWKKNTQSLSVKMMGELVLKGKMQLEDAYWIQTRSPEGEVVAVVAGTIRYSNYKQKYIMIGQQALGKTSLLGEMWYAESCQMIGPWTYMVHIVTHNSQDFYNPMQHIPEISDRGSYIYFEGTYVAMFDKGPKTPAYDYNQQMYRLDLDSVELKSRLPVPIYMSQKTGKYYSNLNCKQIQSMEIEEALKLMFYAHSEPFILRDDGIKEELIAISQRYLNSEKTFQLYAVHDDDDSESEVLFYAIHPSTEHIYPSLQKIAGQDQQTIAWVYRISPKGLSMPEMFTSTGMKPNQSRKTL